MEPVPVPAADQRNRTEAALHDSCFRQHPWLVVVGIAVSVLLSLWTYHLNPIINNDGVYYILAAQHIAADEWREAFQVFKWPAYSFLVYLVQLLPGIDFQVAAHTVTGAGFTLACLAFVRVAHALGGRGRTLWLALFTVLAYPGFNEFRALMIRDAMFLALYLFALSEILWYLESGRGRRLLLAAAALLLATLFRVESLVFLCLLPLFLMFMKAQRGRWMPLALGYLLGVLPLLALFYGWWLYRPGANGDAGSVMVYPWDVFAEAMQQLLGDVATEADAESHRLPATTLAGNLGASIWLVFSETVRALSIPYALILVVEAARGRALDGLAVPARKLLAWFVVTHLLVLVLFALVKMFLAPRYPVALAVTLLLLVPFALNRYLDTIPCIVSHARRRLLSATLLLLLTINALEGVDNVSDKFYLREAAQWLNDNAEPGYRIASNDLKFLFYAGRYREKWVAFRNEEEFRDFLRSDHWKRRDYVAVNVRRRDGDLEEFVEGALDQPPVRQFESQKGDRMLIFYTGDD